VISTSIGHSSSAYSLPLVMPERQRDRGQHDHSLPAPEGEGRQPPENSRAWQVRCTT
jgi:hypothetical protein